MNYLDLLIRSYEVEKNFPDSNIKTRATFLSEYIFNFITYDEEKDKFFVKKAIEVCKAINNRTTFDYIKNDENYTWFLAICNTPFFLDRLDWGASIRGAWWSTKIGCQIELDSCGLWIGNNQIGGTLKFSVNQWENFISSVIEFANMDC